MALHEIALEDGSLQIYKKWATQYDSDSIKLKYSGHQSVASKWCSLYCIPPHGQDGPVATSNTVQYKLFDAGCGTGLIAEPLSHLIADNTVELYGGDFSQDMLNIATAKKLYKELKIVDLNETIPYPPDSFDSILSSGVFVQNHCGPQCLPNLIRILKKGGYLIATSRFEYYEPTKEEWKKQIEACNCDLIEDNFTSYRPDAQAILMVIRKR